MIIRSPIMDTPTSIYKISQLVREAEALEQEGRNQEATVLRSTIHSLRDVIDEMKITSAGEDRPHNHSWRRISHLCLQ